MLKAACGKQTVGLFEWFFRFECDLVSAESPQHLRRLSTSKIHENMDRVMELVHVKKLLSMKLLKFWEFDLGQFRQFLKTV